MNNALKPFIVPITALVFFTLGWFSHTYLFSDFEKMKKKSISFLEHIKKRKSLNVVLLNAPSTYYIGVESPQGFEYDLLRAYAKHLHADLNITAVRTVKEALSFSNNKHIDIISASLAKTPLREKKYHFGPAYFEVQEQVVCSRKMIGKRRFPRDVEDLANVSLVVGSDTSYSETIKALREDGFDINATTSDSYSSEDLLEMVSNEQIDCTITDSNIYALNLKYFPDIALAFSISGREQLAWILPKNATKLEADMYTWINDFEQKGKMTQLKDRYYSNVLFFDYYNTKVFYQRIKTRLPKYETYFKTAAKKYNLSWTLLAAMSYQESHWNPKAKSFTGVRGLMMLTRNTAKILGVKNRLDPKESIFGGTKHLRQMIKYLPDSIVGDDRLKYALAAYNIGMGHIRDAMRLAEKLGLNQNLWRDFKMVLPLLSQKNFYKSLKYGYARGSEPVKYVEAIYNYKDILDKYLLRLSQEENKKMKEEHTLQKP